MNERLRAWARRVASHVLSAEELRRLDALPFEDEGFGYDAFGMEMESAALAYAGAAWLYDRWFRVKSVGHEHVPTTGRALIAPNHSGLLPLDAAMVGVDLIKNLPQPRLMRAVVDHFVAHTPFANTFIYRAGQVVGNRKNFESLLDRDHLVAVFPEGAKGTGKLFSERYQLRPFNVGFVELALTYRAPIVPTAIIGAEEQAPIFYNVRSLARLLKLPYFPITPTFPWLGPAGLIPYPVRYHIIYGEPFHFYREYPPETVEDTEVVRMLVTKVRERVQSMVDAGLREYGLFALGGAKDGEDEEDAVL